MSSKTTNIFEKCSMAGVPTKRDPLGQRMHVKSAQVFTVIPEDSEFK